MFRGSAMLFCGELRRMSRRGRVTLGRAGCAGFAVRKRPLPLRYFGFRDGAQEEHPTPREKTIMKISGIAARRHVAGICAASLLGALGAATLAAPAASAETDCSASAVSGTVSSVTGAAHQYLSAHPGANQVVTAAYGQPRSEAAANIRGYFTANPQEYYELRGILAPIGDVQQRCNVTVLTPDLESAYSQFMAG